VYDVHLWHFFSVLLQMVNYWIDDEKLTPEYRKRRTDMISGINEMRERANRGVERVNRGTLMESLPNRKILFLIIVIVVLYLSTLDGANPQNPFWYLHYFLSFEPHHPANSLPASILVRNVIRELKSGRGGIFELTKLKDLKKLQKLLNEKRIWNRIYKKQVLEIYDNKQLLDKLETAIKDEIKLRE